MAFKHGIFVLKKVKIDGLGCLSVCVCLCVHLCVCMCACMLVCIHVSVCPPIASHISETSASEAIAVKFDTMTASVTRMHHMLIILNFTFIQGHTDFNHENNKCLIISETVQLQAMFIKFAVNIVRRRVYTCIIFSQSDDIDLHSRSQRRLKLDYCITCAIIVG